MKIAKPMEMMPVNLKLIINSPFHKVFELEHFGGLRRSRSFVGKGSFLRVSPGGATPLGNRQSPEKINRQER